ncbi:MAG: hypothetical protein A3F16_04660 [Deltaproteobacteria bacterium RIFCSPHIGHO2_12_FULL_43_9]|nr:MAG: hypothetical protein A3F16_04660 [Deltaproteobacteria bacterium RIFCSPHIGHO2_12_FULL_43_9]
MNFRKKGAKSGLEKIDLTPMIDVVFQLLIFFMVSTTFIVTPGLKLNLPEASNADTVEQTQDLTVELKADNTLYLNKSPVDIKNLESDLRSLAAGKDPTLIIKADGTVSHSSVVEVMDVARKVGLKKLAIATKPKEE